MSVKTYFKLLLLLVLSFLAFGQEKTNFFDPRDNNVPIGVREHKAASKSDYIDTFAVAFNDPNVLIGVF